MPGSVPGRGGQAVFNVDIAHQPPAVGRAQAAVRADVIAGQREMQVVAAQRIEARVGGAVRNSRIGVDGQVFAVGLAHTGFGYADAQT